MTLLQTWPASGSCCRPVRAAPAMLAFVVAVLVAACTTAPTGPESMLDAQADFNSYETFGWGAQASSAAQGEPMSMVETAIRAAIVAEMKSRGYVEAPVGRDPDLLIDYAATRTDKVKSNPFRIGIGVGSYGSHGGASIGTSTSGVRNVTEGSLVIQAVDSARNAEVWRSRVSRELDKGGVDTEQVNSVIAEVFGDFPARTITE